MKSLFPLNPEYEDPLFDDPDSKFKSLKYSDDIPEPYPHEHKVKPLSISYPDQAVPRQQGPVMATFGFLIGWFIAGHTIVIHKYGHAITKWRYLWVSTLSGLSCSFLALFSHSLQDYNFSPHASGRRRGLYYEEIMRNSIDAQFGVFESIEKIMASRERISRQEFYEIIVRNYEKQVKDLKSQN
jgi:hypothetical protein